MDAELKEIFAESAEASRKAILCMTLLALHESGISLALEPDRPVIDMGKFNELDYDGEFTITDDGERTRSLIDDRLPTVAIGPRTFTGQLELMAANLLDTPNRRFNIIGLATPSFKYMNIVDGKVYANHCFMVQPNGEIVFGGFEDPIEVSAIEEANLTVDSRDLVEKSTDCKLFTNRKMTEYLRDKGMAKEVFKEFILPGLPSVACYNKSQLCDVDDFLDRERALGTKMVAVKPCQGHSGVGISFCPADYYTVIRSKIQEIISNDDGALVERFVDPIIMTDENGQQLWTNIRAASIGSMSTDSFRDLMKVRAGVAGQPVNTFYGAEIKPIDWLLEKVKSAGIDPDKVVNDIMQSQLAIRKTGVKTFGADYIVDNDGNVHLIEVNTIYFGAICFTDQGETLQLPERIQKASKLLNYIQI